MAIVYALRRFRVYLQGLKFRIITDCNALTQALKKREVNPRIERWALELQSYDYVLEHREGRLMSHVDGLSRSTNICIVEDNSFEYNLTVYQSQSSKIKEIRDKLTVQEDPLYELRNGLVYRKSGDRILFYAPENMENNIMVRYHDGMGHIGADKMCETLRKNYWFPNLKSKATEYVRNCLKCIAYAPKSGKVEGLLHPIPKGKRPFDTIHIDHLGPVYKNNSAKKHILVIIDAFTKFVKLYATKTTASSEAIACLIISILKRIVNRKL